MKFLRNPDKAPDRPIVGERWGGFLASPQILENQQPHDKPNTSLKIKLVPHTKESKEKLSAWWLNQPL